MAHEHGNNSHSDSGAAGHTSKSDSASSMPESGSGKAKTPYRGGAYRSAKRRSHHEDAHADDAPAHPPEAALDHDLVFRGPPTLITAQRDLSALVERLKAAGSFAYDTEFIGEATFTPKLCLIQIATTTEVALIDPLAQGLDLMPIWKLLCDGSVEKVLHAGQQDVEPVVRLTGDRPRAVFDTQIAAGFVSMTYPVALAKLAHELLGVRMAKSMTFTQWDARPLSSTQLKYAADDVRFLPAIRAELARRLEAGGHTARARDEFEALCEPTQYVFDPNTYIFRVRGSGSLTPNQLRVLRELVVWRDAAARAADVPARAYLKDEILVDMSRSPVKTAEKLSKVRGLPRPVEHEHGAALLAATARGLTAPPIPGVEAEKNEDPGPSLKFKADKLWTAAQVICHNRGIDPMLATSRTDIGKLTYAVLTGKPLPSDLRVLQGWRRSLVGDALLAMLNHGGEVGMRW